MPAKTSSKDNNRRLTQYFAPRPPTSTSAPATSSSHAATTARKRPATRASTSAVDREFPANSSAPPQVRSASAMVTRKRARSSDSDDRTPSSPPTKLKSSRRSTKTAVVLIKSPLSRNTPARGPTPVHINTLVTSPSDSSKQVVYSSQSDEEELVLLNPEPRDLGKVAEGVHAWRRKTFDSSRSSPSRACEDSMEVDLPPSPSSPVRGSPDGCSTSPHSNAPVRSTATSWSSPTSPVPLFTSASPPSPDANDLPSLPPTPQPIDPETKTAQIIAKIKAKAFAALPSSDDEQPLSYRELEDSDDGDHDLPLIVGAQEKSSVCPAPRATNGIFSSPLSSAPSTFNDEAGGFSARGTPDRSSPSLRPTRTSARNRKPAVAFRLPLPIVESSTSVGARKSAPIPPNGGKSRPTNPLAALLREKELEDKRGTSSAAVRLAEDAIRRGSRETSVGSDELDTLDRLRLVDEQAAWKAVYESRKSSSPDDLRSVDNFTIGDRESKLLGPIAGEAVNKILASDKDSKGKAKAPDTNAKTALGVSLWIQPSDEDMEVDSILIPPLSGHTILTSLDLSDDSLQDMILRSGVLAVVPQGVLLSNMPRLLSMALFTSSKISDAIYSALCDMWNLDPPTVQMPFTAILSALVQLGANPSVLDGLGFDVKLTPVNHVTRESFREALRRLLAIVKAAGFAGAFSSSDIVKVVLSLVVMGLDPFTSNELHTQLNTTLDAVCNHDMTNRLILDIHQKVLCFARQLGPADKAQLVSLFASGSGPTRFISRHLAYCLLVPAPPAANDQAPPLEPLILLLSPEAGSFELFDVANESTDYDELRHHVDILSMALTDIAPYVEEERNIMKSTSSTVQGSPNKHKSPTPLELLRKALDALQGKIVDTRAAHLDRSRTKAAIQRLSMRIYYDRMALAGIRPRQRASTLKAYFSPRR